MLLDFGLELFPIDGNSNHFCPESQFGHTISAKDLGGLK